MYIQRGTWVVSAISRCYKYLPKVLIMLYVQQKKAAWHGMARK